MICPQAETFERVMNTERCVGTTDYFTPRSSAYPNPMKHMCANYYKRHVRRTCGARSIRTGAFMSYRQTHAREQFLLDQFA